MVLLCILSISSWSLLSLLGSLLFLFFIVLIFGWNVPLIYPIFLKRSLVLPLLLSLVYFYALFIKEDLLVSPCYSLECCISCMYLSLSPFLFTSLLSSAICKSSSDNHLAFLLFFFLGMVLFVASCTILWTSMHSSLDTLFTRSNSLNLFVTSTA